MDNPFDRFEARHLQRDEERNRISKRLRELNDEGEKDAIAVAQLKLIYPNGFPVDAATADEKHKPDAVEPAPLPPLNAARLQQQAADMTVKDMALTILRDAHPNGLTASQIKGKAFLKFRKQINSNTLTVSLVRLKPKVRCEGRTWFYIREGLTERLLNAGQITLEDLQNAQFGGAAE